MRLFIEGKGIRSKEPVFNPGIPSEYYWFRFVIINEDDESHDIMIDIANSRINYMELYEQSHGLRTLGVTGDFLPFRNRVIEHKNYIFPTRFAPGELKEFFLFVDQKGHVFNLPIEIYHNESYYRIVSRGYFTDGITYGILLFMALLTLVFFISTSHYLYLYYSLYIFVSIAWLLSYFGLGFQYIWPNAQWINTAAAPAFASLNILLNIQICTVLLRVKENSKRLHIVGNVIKTCLFLFAVLPVLINLNNSGYMVNSAYLFTFLSCILISVGYIVYIIFLYAFRGNFNARFYLLANALKVPSLINLVFFEVGMSPGIHNLEGFMQSGLLVEIAILTFAISKRYTLFKFRTFQRVIKAEEDQRQAFSKELHDGISNSLSAIRFQLQQLIHSVNDPVYVSNELKQVSDNIGLVQVEARNISHNLMPNYIRSNSFIDIIRLYIQAMQRNHEVLEPEASFPVIHFSSNNDSVELHDDTKLHLFRIMQEVLSNIMKHSRATEVDIVITVKRLELVIVVSDNGIGLNLEEVRKGHGNGIENIFSRIRLINGRIEYMDTIKVDDLSSEMYEQDEWPRRGTTIVIKIPLKKIRHPKFHMYDY